MWEHRRLAVVHVLIMVVAVHPLYKLLSWSTKHAVCHLNKNITFIKNSILEKSSFISPVWKQNEYYYDPETESLRVMGLVKNMQIWLHGISSHPGRKSKNKTILLTFMKLNHLFLGEKNLIAQNISFPKTVFLSFKSSHILQTLVSVNTYPLSILFV